LKPARGFTKIFCRSHHSVADDHDVMVVVVVMMVVVVNDDDRIGESAYGRERNRCDQQCGGEEFLEH
jgi:hypothetical protein